MSYRISITGTESTGKTILAGQLAGHYDAVIVPDFSRDYIDRLTVPYSYNDVLEIAKGIIELEDKRYDPFKQLLISDNDLLNIKIWLRYYNWEVPAWLNNAITMRKYDLYLLCYPDLPWIPDSQRNNPNDREVLFNQFKTELSAIKADFVVIKGTYNERFNNALKNIDNFLKK